MVSCAKNTLSVRWYFWVRLYLFLTPENRLWKFLSKHGKCRGSQDVLPRMSHGNRGRVVLPVVVVPLTSALWKPRQGIWEMVSWWVEPFTRNGWWSQNHMRSGFEIWNFKNDILGEPIHTMHTYCWVVCFFSNVGIQSPGPIQDSIFVLVFLYFQLFSKDDLQQTQVFLHLTKFEKKHITSYKNTCEKIWAIIHGYATYPCLIPGGYVGVGRLTRHESSQSSPSYYPGMWAFISPLPCRTFREHLPDLGGSWAHTTCCGRELQGSLPGNGGWLGSWWPVVFSSSRNWWVIDGNSGVSYLSNWKPGFLWI